MTGVTLGIRTKMPDAAAKTSVLWIDPDAAFLESAAREFGEHCQDEWEIKTSSDAGAALELLKSQPFELVVLDTSLEDGAGLQLLQSLDSEFPDLPKVILTSDTPEETRLAGLDSGAELFLEKPGEGGDLSGVFATLQELVRWQKRQGSRATMRDLTVLDFVKMECRSGNSRLFEIWSEEARGQVYVKNGAIIHAETEGRRGQSAFGYLVSLPGLQFQLKHYVEPPEQSVDRQWEFLVLEAFRLVEQRVEAEAEARARESAEVNRHQSDKGEEEEHEEDPSPMRKVTRKAAEALNRKAAPPPARKRRPQEWVATPQSSTAGEPGKEIAEAEELDAGELPEPAPPAPLQKAAPPPPIDPPDIGAAPVSRPLVIDGGGAGFQIEEILVCSKEHEVLYESKCQQTEPRVRFIEALVNEAVRLTQTLPLGTFDRIEILTGQGRTVIQDQPDILLFMRTNTRLRSTSPESAAWNQTLTQWMEQKKEIGGVFACGVAHPNQLVLGRSFSPDFPEHVLTVPFVSALNAFDLAFQSGDAPWQIRWIHEYVQFYCVRRSDGYLLGVFMVKNPNDLDVWAVEQMFGDFPGLLPG